MELDIELMGGKKVNAIFNGFTIATDAPKAAGGEGTAPSPTALLLASIGTCAGFYIQFFCEKHGISKDKVELKVRSENDQTSGLIGRIVVHIEVTEDFPEKYLNAIRSAADVCVVKKNIQNHPVIDVLLNRADGGSAAP